jgi:NitT/TauT family transport system permease protein
VKTIGPTAVAPEGLEIEARADVETEIRQAPTRKRRSRRRARDVMPVVGVFLIFIGLWYGYHYSLPSYKQWVVPLPHDVLLHGFTEKDNPTNPVSLLEGLLITSRVALQGLVIAIVLGMVIAVLMSQAKWIESSLYPYAVAVQAVPILAIVPVLRTLFGQGLMARTVVCVMISIFPIIINTLFGLKSAEPLQHDLFTLHGAGRWRRLGKLQLPAALPAVFEGFRIAAGLSVVGAIVGEFFFRGTVQPRGLGILIDLYTSRLWGEQAYAAIIVAAGLSLFFFWGFGLLRNAVVGRWYQASR